MAGQHSVAVLWDCANTHDMVPPTAQECIDPGATLGAVLSDLVL